MGVQRLLGERGLRVSVRTVERAVADLRRERRVAQLATVRIVHGSTVVATHAQSFEPFARVIDPESDRRRR